MRFLLQPKWFRLQLISIMLVSLNGLVTARSAVSSNNPITDATEHVLIVPSVTIAITTGAQTTCAGMTVTFTATPTNGGAGPTYQWKNGGTNITGATNVTYTSTTLANGNAITCVMTSNAAGASPTTATSNSIAMTVTQYAAGTITNGATATFCGNGTLTAAPLGAAYQWKRNGVDLPSATSSTYSTTASGNYTVAITVQPGSCSMITSATVVTVNPLPTATSTPASVTTFCQGGSVVLNAATSTGVTYQWQKDGTNIPSATATSYTANATGSYAVVVTNTATTCTNTSTANAVTVNPLPTATITNGATAAFCTGSSVTLTATTVAGATYQWKNSGTDIPAATASTYNATAAGSYTVSVTITATSCAATSTATAVTVNPLPTATITNGATATFCASGILTATTVTGATYQWKNGGTNIPSATASTYAAPATGSYTVAVTITATTCSATSSATAVTVNPNPTSTITNGATATFCGSGTLTAAAVTGATYQWKNSGTNIPSETAATYSAVATGSYTVATTITATGCNTTSTATTVTVNPLPTATSTPASVTTFCQGGSVLLNAATSTGVTYQWQKDGTNIPSATMATYTANATGAYRIVVTNTATTCTNTSPANAVTVNAFPTATIMPASSSTFCAGGSVVLNANTGTGLAYQWKESGNDILNATNASYTTSTAGSYTVVVTNVSSCATTSTANPVIVNPLPTATATPASITTFCQGGNVVLNANTGTGLMYQWKNNGNNLSGETNASYTANATGSYTVVVTNANSCVNTSNANSVTVNALPTATATPASATTFCQGSNVILNANVGAGLTYQWKNNGIAVPTATYPSFNATTSGSYTVDVMDANCMNTSTANVVTVNALPTATSTAAGVTTFCQGGNVVLNANTGTGLTYQWKKNGAVIPMATNPSYTANTSGAYTIVVTDGNNCMNSASTNVTVNPLPNTNISYVTPTTFCQGGNVVLSVPHVPNALYEWSRNGVTIPNAEMAHYVATTSGNYSVEVLDVNLCYSESAATAVTVNTNPSPVITVNGNTNFCEGDSVQLTASGGLTYLWSTTSTNAAIWLRAGGFYTVTVSNGNCSATAAQQVSPRAVPPASIAAIGPLTFCRGSNVTLNANTGTGLTYQWQKNGSPVLGSTNSTFVTDTTGSYRVIVTGTNGCTTTTSALTVTSNPNPMARLTPSAPVTLCQGDSARFSISGGTTYLWSNNRTDTAFWVKTGGAYAVTVTDANGCTAYAANSLTINALPMATITAGGVTSVCPDDVVSLNAPVGAGYMYQWRRNGNAIGTSRVFNATTAGAYTVSVTDANGCKANSDTTKVIYFNRPTVGFTNSLQSGTGSVMNFTNTSSAGTVRWYFGDALNSTSTQTNPSFTYRSNGTYSVRLVVTNANGCSDSTAASVMITGARTGVNDLVEPLRINVFPNPFAESVQIEIENTTVNFGNNDKIMVTNALGQMVYQAVLNQKSMSVDTQNWSEGIYNVMIYSNGQMIPVKKVVKVVR